MIAKLLLLALLIFAWFWLRSWYKSLDRKAQKKAMWNIAVGVLIAIMLFAFATGRMHWAGLAFAIVLGAFKFLATAAVRFSPVFFSLARNRNFSTPEFRTKYLNVKLQFGNQTSLEGHVIAGPQEGKQLSELNKEELIALANHYKDDCKRSYYLILVALQKADTNFNNSGSQQQNFDDAGGLSRTEAMQILGLDNDFTEEDVKVAHRKLIQKLHPDKGGNAYLASRVNLAKTTLLETL